MKRKKNGLIRFQLQKNIGFFSFGFDFMLLFFCCFFLLLFLLHKFRNIFCLFFLCGFPYEYSFRSFFLVLFRYFFRLANHVHALCKSFFAINHLMTVEMAVAMAIRFFVMRWLMEWLLRTRVPLIVCQWVSV